MASISDSNERAASVLMVGLAGPRLDTDERARLADLRPAGLTLFSRNLESPQQCRALVREVLPMLSGPGIVAIDEEGGRVSRLRDWIGATPSAATLARREPHATWRMARATGRALASLGISFDFAPVVDVCDTDSANGIGDRSFGRDLEQVCRHGGAVVAGLQSSGVAACLKHFPGLGPTRVDSHIELPRVDRDAAALRRIDLPPFAHLGDVAAGVMVGHGEYRALDPAGGPATLSKAIIEGVLLRELGYRGLVVSDDMEMGAVAALDADGAGAMRAIEAGCRLLLYCSDLERAANARDAIAARAVADHDYAARLDRASRQVATFAHRWPVRIGDQASWTAASDDLQRTAASLA